MKRKKIARASAAVLAAIMTVSATTVTGFAFGDEQVSVRSDSRGQMSSEPEVVYNNTYSDATVRTQNFDSNWKFYLGDAGEAQGKEFDDSKWESISIPHDYSIIQDYQKTLDAESGYLPGGTGWYRKHFVVGKEMEGKELRLDFDGVYMNATVYVNGEKLGTHPYGYTPFSFDITDKVKIGEENVVAVKVDHKTPSSRWYSGSGIYRSVHLSVMDKVHVGLNGTKVETPGLKSDTENVTTNIKTTVQNEGTEKASVELTHNIFKKGTEESIGKVTTQAQEVEAGKSQVIEASVNAKTPSLWSPENPALYTVRTEVKVGGKVVDTYETEFGFRYFEMKTDKGAYLNGEKIKLKGVCMHHDQGSLGSAAYRRAIERQVDILKEMGCNSIRVTHNPAATVLIEICNEKGMLVIDEIFDGWMYPKNSNSNDYSRWFNKKVGADNALLGANSDMTWAEFDLKATLSRGQNAPSIIMWSLGNEIQEGCGEVPGSDFSSKAPELIKWAQETDSTRMVTIGSNAVKGEGANGDHTKIANNLTEAGGASGTNYSDGSSYDRLHNAHPDWNLYGSETASSINSRGVYYHKGGGGRYEKTRQLSSYDVSKVGWGALASEAWYDVITRDFVAGEYVWTGFDYIGEPTPWNGTVPEEMDTNKFETNPKNSYFGIIDTAGFPKDSYYFYQSQWNDKVNTLHILPTWNKDSIALEGGKAEVVVYSDAAEVDLQLNGKSLGRKKFTEKKTGNGYTYQTVDGKDGHQNLYMTWEVPYQEGTLEAIAYDKNGNKIEKTQGRSVVKTTGKKANLSAKVDRDKITADGKDLAYVEVDVTDAEGNIVPNAEDRVTFKVEGNGELVGVDNGSSPDHDSYKANNKRAFSGKVLAIVRATKEAGSFTVTASADGLKSSKVTVKTVPAESSQGQERQVDSYYMSKNYYVKKNVKPSLAESIEVRYTDGAKEVKNVTWDKIPEDKLATTGIFTVSGQVEGAGKVSVNVNVIDNVVAMLNYSTTVALGSEPNLPERRPVVLRDGEVLNTTFEVHWTKPEQGAYDKEGIVEVKGTADVLGETLPVTASVRMQKASFDIGDSVSGTAAEVRQDCKVESDSLDAINDGSTEYKAIGGGDIPNTSIWSNYKNSQSVDDGGNNDNTAELTFRYDTTFALGKVVIHFASDSWSARHPDKGTTEIYVSPSGEKDSWIKVEAEEDIPKEANSTGVKPYTYTFESPYGATFVKICVTNKDAILDGRKPCTAITEIELMKANEKFITNNTAKLESLIVNGKELDEAALAKDVYTTAALVANLENVKGADNAAVTVLPAYKDSVKLILESEDHATRKVFEIKLNSKETVNPEEENLDYPLDKLAGKAIAGDEYLPGEAAEGPKAFVIDNNDQTHWHTDWTKAPTAVDKRWIGFNFDEPILIDGLRYLPRMYEPKVNGRVTEYAVEYKESDESDWKKATIILPDGTTAETGNWDKDSDAWQLASFEPVKAKQVRLVGVHTYSNQENGNDKHMAVAELRVKTVKPTTDISEEKNGIKVEVLGLNDDGVIEVPFIDAENPVTPAVKLTSREKKDLEWGIDYKVSYENNTEFSTDGKKAKVIVEGIIDYSGKVEKEFTIKKAPRELTGIFVKEMPEKIQYQAGETFDPAGLELTLAYNDKTEETVTYNGHEGDFEFSPALDQELKETDKKVTVTYGGKETVIDITVQPKQVTVTFIVDGQENPVKIVKGQAIGTNMPQDPSKSGHTFKGWNTKKDGSGEVITSGTVVKEDLSVYAIFEKGGTPSKPGKPGDSSDGGSQGQKPGQNGDASNGASNDKTDSVKTGDTTNVIPFVILTVAAVAAILSILALKKRKK